MISVQLYFNHVQIYSRNPFCTIFYNKRAFKETFFFQLNEKKTLFLPNFKLFNITSIDQGFYRKLFRQG